MNIPTASSGHNPGPPTETNGQAAPSSGSIRHRAADRLAPHHLDDLRNSGLNDETIDACEFSTETDPVYIGRQLNWARIGASALGPCLEIPFFDLSGRRLPYVRFKPTTPRVDQDDGEAVDKPRKYESPIKGGNHAYFPPMPILKLACLDTSIPVIITEGEKKTACLCQYGFAALGITGVWNWQKRRPKDGNGRGKGARELIDDLKNFAWKGRTVYICFDSDAADNPNVLMAERLLAKVLLKEGAIVKVLRLPDGGLDAGGKKVKVGADDFLVAHGPEALQKLIDRAATTDSTSKSSDNVINRKPWEGITDPHYLARELLAAYHHSDRPTLANFREQLLKWVDGCWQTIPDAEARSNIARFCKLNIDQLFAAMAPPEDGAKQTSPEVTMAMVSNVMQALGGEVLIPQTTPMPSWIGIGSKCRNYIALQNGILDVDAFFRGEQNCLLAHTPNWFSTVRFDYPFDPKADFPMLRAFLDHNLEGVHSAKATMLQRFAGYLLLPDTSLQRFLLMLGEGANGKSVVCAILRAMLGDGNCSSVPLEMFGCRFALETTLGKLANIVAEVGELDKIAEGQIKAYTAGDLMQFEKKFKTPFSARPTARLVLSTNNPPDFRDKSDGLWRRVLLLKFTVQIPLQQRKAGMDQPDFWLAERPGILNWALAGLHDLRIEGRFNEPPEVLAEVDKLRGEANPARRFLTEYYREGTGEIEKSRVYKRYQQWCQDNGHHPLSSNKLATEIYRMFKKVKEGKPMQGGQRIRTFQGLELQPAS
jgi:putative DNA primase/helicase